MAVIQAAATYSLIIYTVVRTSKKRDFIRKTRFSDEMLYTINKLLQKKVFAPAKSFHSLSAVMALSQPKAARIL